MSKQQLKPTISFIIPLQKKDDFLIQKINAIFKFTELYSGFCELIIASDVPKEAVIKLVWLAMHLNKTTHPHVRTKIIRYPSQTETSKLIETGIKHAFGQKIIIALSDAQTELPQIRETTPFQKEVSITRCIFTTKSLEERTFQTKLRNIQRKFSQILQIY